MDDESIRWILGATLGLAGVMFSLWWKVESRQDRKIDLSNEKNVEAHAGLYKKIDATEAALTAQHMALRDKIEDIWKHVVKNK